jgi:hypothetical protein
MSIRCRFLTGAAYAAAKRAIARWTGLWLHAQLLEDTAAKAQLAAGGAGENGDIWVLAAEP